jgi:hypothetical protein
VVGLERVSANTTAKEVGSSDAESGASARTTKEKVSASNGRVEPESGTFCTVNLKDTNPKNIYPETT